MSHSIASFSTALGSGPRSGANLLQSKLDAGENFGVTILKDSLAQSRPIENRLAGSQRRFEASVENTAGLRARLGTGASSAAAQKFKNVGGRKAFANNLEQTVRRGRARQGVINRGEKAIANQQLKDRISIARQKVQRKGVLEGALANAGQIREGVAANAQAANDQVTQAFAGAAGSIAGGLARGFGDKLFGGREVPIGMDLGTASADFQNMDFINNGGGFDFETLGEPAGGVAFG